MIFRPVVIECVIYLAYSHTMFLFDDRLLKPIKVSVGCSKFEHHNRSIVLILKLPE